MRPSAQQVMIMLRKNGASDHEGSPMHLADEPAMASLESLFLRPSRKDVKSAWWGHVAFAHWIVSVVRPETIVELGVQRGVSYAAFCEAVVRTGYSAQCFGIDTWQGDEHAGFYDDQIYEDLKAFHTPRYADFSTLVRARFDDALERFADGSIDLLHIDGLHTYEAVRHDFETWLPKLSSRAIVLFHDTQVREQNFGVWRLWEELCERYPNFEFHHSYGLGVLGVGEKLPSPVVRLCSLPPELADAVKHGFSVIGHDLVDPAALERALQESARRQEEIDHLQGVVADLREETRLANNEIDRLTGEVVDLQHELKQASETLKEIYASTMWRAWQPLRAVGKWLPRPIRASIRTTLSLVWWTLTFWQIPQRLRLGLRPWGSVKPHGRARAGVIGTLGAMIRTARTRPDLAKRFFNVARRQGLRAAIASALIVARRGTTLSPFDYMTGSENTEFLREKSREFDTDYRNRVYTDWIKRVEPQLPPPDTDWRAFDEATLPTISIIMPIYKSDHALLRQAIDSVVGQTYPKWQLCICDDASNDQELSDLLAEYAKVDKRIVFHTRQVNGHISRASNDAFDLAEGEFIGFLDHDDKIASNALAFYVAEILKNRNINLIYSDQDKITVKGERYDPYFKTGYNPDLLRSQNYIDHFAVFRTDLVRQLGGLRIGYEGSQDYDLVLRAFDASDPAQVVHVPRVLYHWRAVPGSIAFAPQDKTYAPERSRKALKDHLDRNQEKNAQILSPYPEFSIHRVKYPLPQEIPLVSIIIPTKEDAAMLKKCIDGIIHGTDYSEIEIIIVDNGSFEEEVLLYYEKLQKFDNIRIVKYAKKFNYSDMNNYALQFAKGEIVCFLNNDVAPINADWLEEMVRHALRPDVGAVGARLLYSSGHVQHFGVVLGFKGVAGHAFRYLPRDSLGPWAQARLTQNFLAVTAACLVVRREIVDQVGGFDSDGLPVVFNDVDLCLKIHEAGYRNVVTPHAELFHLESVTRGTLASEEEYRVFKERWEKQIENDPFFNPNLSRDKESYLVGQGNGE